jgi:hypothetical protein
MQWLSAGRAVRRHRRTRQPKWFEHRPLPTDFSHFSDRAGDVLLLF